MQDDALWYEAALVVGVTNALNVVADALDGAAPELLGPVDEAAAGDETRALLRRSAASMPVATCHCRFA